MQPYQLILMNCVAVVFLAIAINVLHPTAKRALAGMAAGVVGLAFGIVGDLIAYSYGLWHYVGPIPGHAPALAYLAAAIGTGAVALVGWRIEREYGKRGSVIFIVLTGVLMAAGDALVGPQILSPGLLSKVVDGCVWIAIIAVGQGTMKLLAGPASGDRLTVWD